LIYGAFSRRVAAYWKFKISWWTFKTIHYNFCCCSLNY
jgi:hypothetical protein